MRYVYLYGLMPTKKPRLVLYMNPETLEALQDWAKDERRSPSNLVIYLIEKALEQRQLQVDRKEVSQ